jgi:hypothetical protein
MTGFDRRPVASDRFPQRRAAAVTGFHRREPVPRRVHRCARGSDGRGPRPHASGVTVQDTPRCPARGWLRGREWEPITRGVYAAALGRTQFEELAAWQLVLPRTPLSRT